MKITCVTVPGTSHEECEDAVMIYTSEGEAVINHECCLTREVAIPVLIAVADGVGGNPGGRNASEYALKTLSGLNPDMETDMNAVYQEINTRIIDYARTVPGKESMATTLSVALITESNIRLTHTGNTRIQVLNNGYLRQLTRDHTTYQFLMDMGNIEGAEHCNRCEITSCIGGGDKRNLSKTDSKDIERNGAQSVLLLTSDGVHEYVDIDIIEDNLNDQSLNTEEKAKKLIETAQHNGSGDDLSVIIAELK